MLHPHVTGLYLMSSADSREPEPPFHKLFRRDFYSAARVSSWMVASARIRSFRELVGGIFKGTA